MILPEGARQALLRLFDEAFYRTRHPTVGPGSALGHFLTVGGGSGHSPHPLFDAAFYLDRYPDVAATGINPLLHYVLFGSAEERWPHPLFDPGHYRSGFPDALDGTGYPLLHFLESGGAAGHSPHPLFDAAFYLDRYPDVAASGVNPLLHYVLAGDAEMRWPHPLFDPDLYRARNPELRRTGENPLLHYLRAGLEAGPPPGCRFDPVLYRRLYPDVAADSTPPLLHYLKTGMREGRWGCAEEIAAGIGVSPVLAPEAEPSLAAYLDWRYGDAGTAARVLEDRRLEPAAAPDLQSWLERCLEDIRRSAPTGGSEVEVSVVVPVGDGVEHTAGCLRSLFLAGSQRRFEVLVGDDASTDGTAAWLRALSVDGVRHIRHDRRHDRRLGPAAAGNATAAHARGRWLVLLHHDTLVLPGWLDELVDTLERRPDAGLVAPTMIAPDGRLLEAGATIGADGRVRAIGRGDDPRRPEHGAARDVEGCGGAAMALPTALWERLGGMDAEGAAGLAMRVRAAGYRVVFQPLSVLLRFGGPGTAAVGHHGNGPEPATAGMGRTGRRALVIDVSTPTPDRDAGSLAAVHLMAVLTGQGFKVYFMPLNTLHLRTYTHALQRLGIICLHHPHTPSAAAAVERLGPGLDLVVLRHCGTASLLMDAVRTHAPAAKVVFDTVDLHFLREERRAELEGSLTRRLQAGILKRRELDAVARADATVVVSTFEHALLRTLVPAASVHCIPLAHDVPGRAPVPFRDRRDVLFVGGFRHAPNVDAVTFLCGEIWPRLRARGFPGRLLVVGGGMPGDLAPRLAGSGVVLMGHVPDLAGLFAQARLSVAPLRYGAGLKGKVITSLAYGVPCVATSVAIEGSGLEDGVHVLAADDPERIADKIEAAYGDEGAWTAISDAGVHIARARFSLRAFREMWSHLLGRMENGAQGPVGSGPDSG